MKPFCYHSFDLRQLVSFAEIARTGSFRRAAKTLHIAQPALSRQIKQLEAALGINLFDRAPRRLHLTIEGRELAGRLPALFSQIDHLIETVNLHRSQIFRKFVSNASYRRSPRHDFCGLGAFDHRCAGVADGSASDSFSSWRTC